MIEPTTPIIPFANESEKMEYLRKWKLVSAKATQPKQLYYKGLFSDGMVPCEVVGRLDNTFIVISIAGKYHCIHPDYLEEMQPTKKEREAIESAKKNNEE